MQCCCLLDDDAHMPAAVISALQTNGVAAVQFSALSLSANATCPRWLRKVFLGHRGSDLVVALRDAMQPGRFQNAEECDALRQFFFSELRKFGEEWSEEARCVGVWS